MSVRTRRFPLRCGAVGRCSGAARTCASARRWLGERIGLKPVEDGVWELYFGSCALGRFDERKNLVQPLRSSAGRGIPADVVEQVECSTRNHPHPTKPISESPKNGQPMCLRFSVA